MCSGPTASGLVACVAHTSSTYYVYLPLLRFLQFPGISYAVFSFATWLALLFLVRRDSFAAAALGCPFVGLAAANGYNDLVGLLLLTVAFVGAGGRRSRIAELLALGVKQFANVVIVAYHAWRRDWLRVGVALGVTALYLLPFLLWDPQAVVCTVLLQRTASCMSGSGGDPLSHLNYWLYPLWVLAVFHVQLGGWYRRFVVRRAARNAARTGDFPR